MNQKMAQLVWSPCFNTFWRSFGRFFECFKCRKIREVGDIILFEILKLLDWGFVKYALFISLHVCNTVEPRCKEGPRDRKNMFAITSAPPLPSGKILREGGSVHRLIFDY